jgi:hypothetical protein
MYVVADRLAHRAYAPKVFGESYRGEFGSIHVHERIHRGVSGASDLDLHVPESRFGVPPHLVCQPLGVLALRVESGAGVGSHVVAVAAQQAVEG